MESREAEACGFGRREAFRAALGIAAVGAGAMLVERRADAQTLGDIDLLNLALNLEYLMAQYICAVAGVTVLPARLTGSGVAGVPATGGRKVTFTDTLLGQMVNEIANDNHNHLVPIRTVVGAPSVGQPLMDIAVGPTNAFSVLMQRAGVVAAGATFDPYASDENVLYAILFLKNVSVAAYRGLTAQVSNRVVVQNFTGLLGTEAIHAATIRSYLYARSTTTPRLKDNADKIAAFQRTLSGAQAFQGLTGETRAYPGGGAAVRVANVSPANATADVAGRSAAQTLNQLYLTAGAATSGGFFPGGVNGNITSSSATA